MMTYKSILESSPRGDEAMMWAGVERVDSLLHKIEEEHPEIVREFLMKEYEELNGKHFNEEMARELVSDMKHVTKNGTLIEGEIMSAEDMEPYMEDYDKWDMYVAVNAFLHDLARTELDDEQIVKAAVEFWFKDDDFENESKVWWYFTSK